jgi:VanZ family protein
VSLFDNKWLRLAAVVAWMALIFFLSSQSRLPDLSPSFSDALQDILGHFLAYGALALLVVWALEAFGVSRPALWALVVVLLYALSDEFHQSFVPGRHPDLFDIATDVAGALVALALLAVVRLRRRSSSPRSSRP